MATVDGKRLYGRNSRLRWENIVYDENEKAVRLGNKNWDTIVSLKANVGYKTWKITPQYANRPDLIANFFYGSPELWWVITGYNSFFHPLRDTYVDRVIMIPDASGVTALLT